MRNYLKQIGKQYTDKTFQRKVDYIKYNFGEIIKDLSSTSSVVLEIGPGMGECVSYLNSLGINNVDILDNSVGVVKHIKKRFKIDRAYNFPVENIQKLKLKRYDFIFMIQVLEHIKIDKHKLVISTLFANLKPGGYLFIVVPNANNPLGLTERYGDLQHTVSFTTRSLKDLIERSGITNYGLSIENYKIPPYSLVNIIRTLFQKILHIALLAIMIVNGGVYFRQMSPNIVLKLQKRK